MAKPTTSASLNAPDTSIPTISLLGAHARSSLLGQLLHEPCPPLRSTVMYPVTDFWGQAVAPPPWAHPPPQLPRDLLDMDTEKPDQEQIIRELVRWMVHIEVGCDCPDEEAAVSAPLGGSKLQWCRSMEDLVEHATQCTAGILCPVASCALTNGIFRHSETCTLAGCFVCAAAKPFRHNTAGRSAVGLDNDGFSDDAEQASSSQKARLLSIRNQISIQSLVHAGRCPDDNCQFSGCQEMKHALSHTRTCNRLCKIGDCYICKTLTALCCHHAETCQESDCLVPFCPEIRETWKREGTQQEVQRQQFQRRRAAILHRITHTGADAPNPNHSAQSLQSMWMPREWLHPPRMGMQGDSGASSALQDVPANSPGGTLTPPIESSVAPTGTAYRAPASRAAVNHGVASGQPAPQRTAGTTATPYQQLVEALNRPPSHEQQQHVAKIMRGNPELVAGFLRLDRLANRHTQHEQQQCLRLRPAGPQLIQNLPIPGSAMDRMMYQALQGNQFQGGQAAVLQLLSNTGSLNQTDTGTKASVQDVVIPISQTTKITYGWKTWIPKQLRSLQRTPWQCKFAAYMAAVLIAGVLSFFFGLFIGTEYN